MRDNASGSVGQDPGDIERDVAVADDHHSLVCQVDGKIGVFGVTIDPGDHLGGRAGARQAHTVDVQPAIVRCADRVEHGVVVVQQVGVRKVRSHLDVEEEPEAPPLGDVVEQPGDPLGALVVRCHARAHQTIRRRQPFEDVHPHTALGEQLVGGVHRGRPGTDDRHRQRTRLARMDFRGVDHRRQFRRRRQLLARGPIRIERRIESDERQLLGLQSTVGCDRSDRAGADARTAVDTGDGVDVEHFGGREARFVR